MKVISLPPILALDTDTLFQINRVIGCFFFAFTGAYIRELLLLYKSVQKETSLYKIIIGTIIGGLLFFIVQAKYLQGLDFISTVGVNMFSGSLGYEIFSKCSSVENIKQLASDVHDIIKSIIGIDDIIQHTHHKDDDADDNKDSDNDKDKPEKKKRRRHFIDNDKDD